MFPNVDPIPLPAPVALFKLLELLTVTLHFAAVQLLIGGLLVVLVWAVLGRATGSSALRNGGGAIATRLPVVMTYVINLGVPPLLFAQVLYGRAIYTSSVLIGTFWIAVIFLLMLGYGCLYAMAGRASSGRTWGWLSLAALLVMAKIAMIYSSNMTLMIRPEAWSAMYADDAVGVRLNTGDPTMLPRWAFMLLGGLTAGGSGMLLLGLKRTLPADAATALRRWGGASALVGAVALGGCGWWVLQAQPESVRQLIAEHVVYGPCLIGWCVAVGLLAAAALVATVTAAKPRWSTALTLALLTFVQIGITVVCRGGIRDLTLASHGFDVWDRSVAPNWIVVGAFLVLFVMGLGVAGWLISVAARSRPAEERYA